jgi:antitoxin component of RelBE/YafQ-DinJ toxin-antitoxin module
MNAKLTLSFNEEVINKAKKYAEENDISLSRLIEFLLTKVTSTDYQSLEEYPIADWVNLIAEGKAEYQTKQSRKSAKKEFFDSRK